MFIVVDVNLNYDYVDDVHYVAKFNSKEEANEYIMDHNNQRLIRMRDILEYNSKFTESLLGEDYRGNLNKITGHRNIPMNSKEAEHQLINWLHSHRADYPDFIPPQPLPSLDLHIVEIPEGEKN